MKSRDEQLHEFSIETGHFIDEVIESNFSVEWKKHSIHGALIVLAHLGVERGAEKRLALNSIVTLGPLNRDAAMHTFHTRLEPFGYNLSIDLQNY